MSGYIERTERWRTHRAPASRHWPRDPDDTNTHPGSDPALCAICKGEKR